MPVLPSWSHRVIEETRKNNSPHQFDEFYRLRSAWQINRIKVLGPQIHTITFDNSIHKLIFRLIAHFIDFRLRYDRLILTKKRFVLRRTVQHVDYLSRISVIRRLCSNPNNRWARYPIIPTFHSLEAWPSRRVSLPWGSNLKVRAKIFFERHTQGKAIFTCHCIIIPSDGSSQRKYLST